MIRLVFSFLFAVLSFGAASGWASAQTYRVAATPGVSVYTYDQLIEEAATGTWRNPRLTGQVPASAAPLLRQLPFSRFHRLPQNRALALGHPETCPYSVRTNGFDTPQLAAATALEQCLIRVAQFEGYQAEKCGCRLGIVNDLILGDPATTLAIPDFVPTYIEVGGTRVLGLLKHSGLRGSDMPVTFRDVGGQKRCTGTYTIGRLFVNNSFTLSCDMFDGPISGSVGIRDIRSFNPWGLYEGLASDGTSVKIVIAKPLGQPQ